MSMSVTEARAEIALRYQKAAEIENKYPDGLTIDKSHEDFNEAKRLLGEIDDLESKLAGLEDAAARKARILGNVDKYTKPSGAGHPQPEGDPQERFSAKSFARQFVEAPSYLEAVKSGRLGNPSTLLEMAVDLKGSLLRELARKTLVYSASGSGGNLIVNDRMAGTIDILQRQLSILDLIPMSSTTSNTIDYVKEKTYTNNAATVAEASVTTGTTGTKAESVLAYELATAPVRTIAHWIPVTNQMLSDAPVIEGLIGSRLVYGLNQELEDQVLSGDGNSPNMTGILAYGLSTIGLSAGSTYGGLANVVDAAFAAALIVRSTGLAQPNAYVFHPNDWAAVRLMRESSVTGNVNPGGYLYGPPSVSGPATLWGRPVVEALGMTENTVLCGDFQMGCMLFDREQAAISTGTINDQFTRNMRTILAELRAAFAVFRATAFCRVTGA
jgi:HK97 family phage major capsid protein